MPFSFFEHLNQQFSRRCIVSQHLSHTLPICSDKPIFIVRKQPAGISKTNIMLSICHWSLLVTCTVAFFGILFLRKIVGVSWNVALLSFHLTFSIILGVYANMLSVQLSLTREPKHMFHNLDSLANILISRSCRAVIQEAHIPDSPMYDILFPQANATISREIKEKFDQAFMLNPPLVVSNTQSVIKYVQSDSNCHIGFDWFLARPFLEQKYCDLTILELPEVPEQQLIFYASKGWKELSTFNAVIYGSATSADDLYHENLDTITSAIKKTCKERSEGNLKENGLSIYQLWDAILMLLLLLGLAVIMLFAEFLAKKLGREDGICHGDILRSCYNLLQR